jgi:hypothetical protein
MAQLGYTYDPTAHDPDGRPDPFPAGRTKFMILNTDVRTTKAGTGSYLWIELEVNSGPHAGRRWWDQITLSNPNSQAVEIGQKQLSALCRSVGWMRPLIESESLHGLSGEADVGIEPAGTDAKTGKSFGPKNVTRKYVVTGAAEGLKPVPAASGNGAAAEAQPANAAASGAKPWARK